MTNRKISKDRHEDIRYGVGQSTLGRTFVAITNQGICALKPIRDDHPISRALKDVQRQIPQAKLVRDQRTIEKILRDMDNFLSAGEDGIPFPLDLRGTPFQKKVWKELRLIPWGTTCSYSELAKLIGRPLAVRAVASACARNPVAILVPCHRVLRSDGGLGGYRWGVGCKRKLLRRESEASNISHR